MARNDDLCEGYIASWALIPNSCTVVLNDGAGGLTPIDFSFLLDKVVVPDQTSTFDYLPGSHTVVHNGVPHALNCGRFTFNPATCELGYVDEKGQATTALIPQDQFIYDAASCTLTILPAKGGAGMVIPTGVPSTGVNLEFVQTAFGCSLRLTYKDRSIDVPMPNMLVGHQYDCATNTLRFLYCNGDDVTETLAKASMQCNTLDDGTRIITFNDGCGGPTKVFDLQPINMDIDELTIAGSVLTFTSGGDGNPGVVTVDLCEIIATNCNATFTAINPDGSWSFVDNAGTEFTYPAPINCCTFHNVSPNDLDPDTPPATPQGTYPNKQDGDTIIQCHPNGLSYWTCVDGAWVLDFIKVITDVRNYFLSDVADIDFTAPPTTPPASPRTANKIDGDTVLVCYPNGFCAFTCTQGVWARDWCKPVAPDSPPEVHIGSDTPSKEDGKTVWFDPASCIVRFCDDQGNWLQNTAVQCGTSVPPCVKGGPSMFFDLTNGCLMIQCFNDSGQCFWVSASGSLVNQIINSICVQVGDRAPVQLQEIDGKIVVPVPEPGCCSYNVQSTQPIATNDPLAGPSGTATKNPGDTALQKHPDGFSAWRCATTGWVLEWTCSIPVVPTFMVQIGDEDPTPLTPDDSGVIVIPVPATPEPEEPFDLKSQFSSNPGAPANDGSEGCFWLDEDTGCIHILFDGVWVPTAGSAVTQAN